MKSFVLSLGLALLITLPFPAAADDPVRVVDGDGLKIGKQSIRLWGIDAPELDQTCEQDGRTVPCGEDARFLLGALVMGGDLVCETKGNDRYRRIIAQCSAGGHDLASEMVRQGYALDWPRYSGGFYAEQQTEAQENGRGLWAGEFIKPWEWRRR